MKKFILTLLAATVGMTFVAEAQDRTDDVYKYSVGNLYSTLNSGPAGELACVTHHGFTNSNARWTLTVGGREINALHFGQCHPNNVDTALRRMGSNFVTTTPAVRQRELVSELNRYRGARGIHQNRINVIHTNTLPGEQAHNLAASLILDRYHTHIFSETWGSSTVYYREAHRRGNWDDRFALTSTERWTQGAVPSVGDVYNSGATDRRNVVTRVVEHDVVEMTNGNWTRLDNDSLRWAGTISKGPASQRVKPVIGTCIGLLVKQDGVYRTGVSLTAPRSGCEFFVSPGAPIIFSFSERN